MNKPLIAIVGETASGKSSLALEIAKRYDGEIVTADSWQVYRGLDIGTAKPTRTEQEEVRHHMIDIMDPDDNFTAAQYKEMANAVIVDIHTRGKLPILVGGTGLYIDSVLFDFSFMPGGTDEERAELNAKSIDDLLAIIEHEGYDLSDVDVRNKRRLVRLIETKGARPSKSALRENTLVLGVKISRTKLRKNIEHRIDSMMAHGLKHEVQSLVEQYGWGVESLKGIGYREWQPYFAGTQSRAETSRKIVKSTLELAKRQRTWFKRNRDIQWCENTEDSLSWVARFLSKHE